MVLFLMVLFLMVLFLMAVPEEHDLIKSYFVAASVAGGVYQIGDE
jgi:hypothetical protein